jgi:hypothetical protein
LCFIFSSSYEVAIVNTIVSQVGKEAARKHRQDRKRSRTAKVTPVYPVDFLLFCRYEAQLAQLREEADAREVEARVQVSIS